MSDDGRKDTTFHRALEDARDLRREIEHVEGAIKLLQVDLIAREAELRALHHEAGQLRNEISAMHAETAARRSVRRDALVKREQLDTAIAESDANYAEKALMRQMLAHLWTLADQAIGAGS